ncbi:hypothetical protein M9Y10_037178 [Tritrichomonas musculus]|uniref:G domain-containing protein n=1 Tax=Tritrichomonas musculus TaxID=1915356 RepID=A0ABR2GU03_9EUKA
MQESILLHRPIVSKTVEFVAENIKYIKECKGKNITIFIGREQVGKSTTINALLGVPFQICDTNEEIVEPKKGYTIHAPMGDDENEGLMCTIFPRAYIDSNQENVYLDTQGLFGTNKEPNEVVASTVLLDAAIKSASSVKIVYLEDYGNFSKGLTRVSDIVKLLDRIVLKDDIPIYCLFNRYTTNSKPKMKILLQPNNDLQINNMIKEELRTHASKLVSSAQKHSEKLVEKIKNICNNYSELSQNNEILNEAMHEINEIANTEENNGTMIFERSAFIIEKNFQEGRFGYFDPTSEWSVNNIRNEISNLPTIDKNKLSFNCCDQKRTLFSKDFERTLHEILTPLINDVFFSLKYSPDLISKTLENEIKKMKKYKTLLSDLENGNDVDLSEFIQDLYEQQQSNKEMIVDLTEQISKIRDDIDRIMNSEPVNYRDFPFYEPLGFFYKWRTSIVRYNDEIPFVRIDENLGVGTFREKFIDFDQNKFIEYYIDNQSTILKLKETEEPVSSLEIKYTSATNELKAKIIGQQVVAGITGAVIGALELYPLIPVLGTVLGVISSKDLAPCEGMVSFYVRYQDKEKNYLNKLFSDKEKLKKMLSKTKKINENIVDKGRKNLTESIAQLDKNTTKLDEILNHTNNTLKKWNSRNDNEKAIFHTLYDELLAYNMISQMLYPNCYNNESVRNYEICFQRLIKGIQEITDTTANDIIKEFKLRNINNRIADLNNE